jgi:hypothetical protein
MVEITVKPNYFGWISPQRNPDFEHIHYLKTKIPNTGIM